MKPGDLVRSGFKLYLLDRSPQPGTGLAATTGFIMEESALGLIITTMDLGFGPTALVLVGTAMGYAYINNLRLVR